MFTVFENRIAKARMEMCRDPKVLPSDLSSLLKAHMYLHVLERVLNLTALTPRSYIDRREGPWARGEERERAPSLLLGI